LLRARNADRRTGPGRPAIDDCDPILGLFAAHLAHGQTISQIARRGLKIYGYQPCPDGSAMQLTVLRELGAATLERRYRLLRGQLDEAFAWRHCEPALVNARYVGGASHSQPIGFGKTPKLKWGRPRKILSRG
jgi:hypothetical protein